MSLIDQIVNVTITRQTVFPSVPGFGIPLLLAYHTRTPSVLDFYSSTDAMIDDGFETTDPAYQMVQAAFNQNPRPTQIALGRRTRTWTMIVKLLPKNLTVGFIYSLTYIDASGVETEITYTVQNSDTAVIIGTAIKTAIDALADSAATVNNSTGEVTVTASVAGVPFDIKGLPKLTDLHVAVTTVDGGIVADYNAVKAVDAQTWYGVAIDSCCKAEIEALAAALESDKKIFIYETSDSDCADNTVTSDVMSDLKAAGYARTGGLFAQERLRSYRSSAWLAKGLASGAQTPGGTSWSFLTLNGITIDNLSDDSITKIQAKRGNIYVGVSGLNFDYSDLVADNEHIDQIVGSDWLFANLQADVLGAFYNASNSKSKIPYTDDGVNVIRGIVLARLAIGVKNGFLANQPAPTCTVPKVADVPPNIRALRQLQNVNFSAQMAGAINSVVINGTLSV
jgi:hypothetical protein